MTERLRTLATRAVRNRAFVALTLTAGAYCAVSLPVLLLWPAAVGASYAAAWSWLTVQLAAHPILWPFLASAVCSPLVVASILRADR